MKKIDHSGERIFKIVYHGPMFSGKSTNLEVIRMKTPDQYLVSIPFSGNPMMLCEFFQINIDPIGGIKVGLQLFSVPGSRLDSYTHWSEQLAKVADGVVFVADSQSKKLTENIEAMTTLAQDLAKDGRDISAIPLVIQWNKRDLSDVLAVAELEERVNYLRVPSVEAVAVTGQGVFPTLKECLRLVLVENGFRGF